MSSAAPLRLRGRGSGLLDVGPGPESLLIQFTAGEMTCRAGSWVRWCGWVADRGFISGENRAYLSQDDESYIIGEKLRGGSKEASRALSWPGRYREVAENLQVKVVVLEDDRFVIRYSPEQAVRDAGVRERILKRLEVELEDSDQLTVEKRSELLGEPKTKPRPGRLPRVTKAGLLRVDRAAVQREAHLDG